MIAKAKVAVAGAEAASGELRAGAEDAASALGIELVWLTGGNKAANAVAASGALVAVAVCPPGSGLAAELDAALGLPVLAVPVAGPSDTPLEALMSAASVGCGGGAGRLAIGLAGIKNAILMAASILATGDVALRERVVSFRSRQTERVLALELPDLP